MPARDAVVFSALDYEARTCQCIHRTRTGWPQPQKPRASAEACCVFCHVAKYMAENSGADRYGATWGGPGAQYRDTQVLHPPQQQSPRREGTSLRCMVAVGGPIRLRAGFVLGGDPLGCTRPRRPILFSNQAGGKVSYFARRHWQAGGLQLALLCLALPAPTCTQVPRQPTHPSVPHGAPLPMPRSHPHATRARPPGPPGAQAGAWLGFPKISRACLLCLLPQSRAPLLFSSSAPALLPLSHTTRHDKTQQS